MLSQIRALTDSQPKHKPIRIAVAFWGNGAQAVFHPSRQYEVICNLTTGGTNPAVIRDLRTMPNVRIRHLTQLHAKVILADKRAIVGSANFSANGLGFEGSEVEGWLEAAAVIDGADVDRWFDHYWRTSAEISDGDLAFAELMWTNRTRPNFSEPSLDHQPQIPEPVPVLLEADLFKPQITGGNKIRMAARAIELIYFGEIEAETKRSVWNPAYAASLVWTTAGNSIRTRIEHCEYFKTPSDVLARAKHAKTIEKVHRFVQVLSSHTDVPPAVRYWAGQYIQSMA
ncbi:MAG: phospholipase D family protein [Rhodanobacter sp.]|nr:phospholipase D family protein [Rhodanobacter sp.]